jgi:hypothetical protein
MNTKSFLAAINTGKSIEVYHMLFDGEWWACQTQGSQLVFHGEQYAKICDTNFCGHEGQRVLGLFNIFKVKNLAPMDYEFVFVDEDLMAGNRLKNLKEFLKYYTT